MDPNMSLALMLDARRANALGEAYSYATNLLRWLDGGGFPPRGHTADSARALAVNTVRQCAAYAD